MLTAHGVCLQSLEHLALPADHERHVVSYCCDPTGDVDHAIGTFDRGQPRNKGDHVVRFTQTEGGSSGSAGGRGGGRDAWWYDEILLGAPHTC